MSIEIQITGRNNPNKRGKLRKYCTFYFHEKIPATEVCRFDNGGFTHGWMDYFRGLRKNVYICK